MSLKPFLGFQQPKSGQGLDLLLQENVAFIYAFMEPNFPSLILLSALQFGTRLCVKFIVNFFFLALVHNPACCP
jgi:hypothetical protein